MRDGARVRVTSTLPTTIHGAEGTKVETVHGRMGRISEPSGLDDGMYYVQLDTDDPAGRGSDYAWLHESELEQVDSAGGVDLTNVVADRIELHGVEGGVRGTNVVAPGGITITDVRNIR